MDGTESFFLSKTRHSVARMEIEIRVNQWRTSMSKDKISSDDKAIIKAALRASKKGVLGYTKWSAIATHWSSGGGDTFAERMVAESRKILENQPAIA